MNPAFPTVDYSAGLGRLQRQTSLRQIEQSAARVCVLAHTAVNLRRRAAAIVGEISAYVESNMQLALAPARRIAAYVLMWLAPFAACVVDFVLLGSVLEFFAHRVYSDPQMVTVTRTVIPIAIVTIEMIISAQRSYAHEQAAAAGHARSHWLWHLFPLLMVIPLPTLVIATNIAAAPAARTAAFELVLKLQLVGLVALSVVMHGIILYGGELAAEARGYLFSKVRLWRGNRTLKRLHSRFESTVTELANAYTRQVRLVDDHNMQFGTHLGPGPFDLVSQELLAEIFGDPDRTVVEFPSRVDAA